MKRELTNQEQYSNLWEKESQFLESHGVYSWLSKITPSGKVLEFGCGIGNGTYHLSIDHDVLSLDSNSLLIEKARSRTSGNVVFHQCDFFDLIDKDKAVIADFNPQVVVGWFIGGCGIDIFKHAKEEPNEAKKSTLYREKIEDVIVSPTICLGSVEYIHLVNRGSRAGGFSEAEVFKSTKEDYDMYVFGEVGFEVVEVNNINWPREGSDFQYGQAHNPNFAGGQVIPTISSIMAKRVKP